MIFDLERVEYGFCTFPLIGLVTGKPQVAPFIGELGGVFGLWEEMVDLWRSDVPRKAGGKVSTIATVRKVEIVQCPSPSVAPSKVGRNKGLGVLSLCRKALETGAANVRLECRGLWLQLFVNAMALRQRSPKAPK
jgi:hypothetical protein